VDKEGGSDWASRTITNAETPEELREALQVIRVDEDFALDGFPSIDSHGGFARYRPLMQEMMLRMRDRNPEFPPVPTSDNSVDYVNWCVDATRAKAFSAGQAQAGTSAPPEAGGAAPISEATPAGANTPETNPALIYQADAAQAYNIPKSTLTKLSKKKPGELGYLWSGHKDGRVFYRKADVLRLSRSRTRLGRTLNNPENFPSS